MAIKILIPGKPLSEIIYTASCRSCGCKFSFQREDTKVSGDPRDTTVAVVDCPQSGCGMEVYTSL